MRPPIEIIYVISNYITIYGNGRVVVMDKNGNVVRVIPEKGYPGEYPEKPVPLPTPWKHAETIAAGLDLLINTQGVKEAEELRAQTGKYLTSVIQTMTTEVMGKTTTLEH